MTPTPDIRETPQRFSEIDLDIHYEGPGEEILARFVLPMLQTAVAYDRLTSFFSVNSLLAIAQGIEALWRRQGKMRLILGIHDVPEELVSATGEDVPELAVASVRQRLLEQISTLRDELSRDRLATLAWMIQDDLLCVRVAAPTSGRSSTVSGVFHSKRFVFRDADGQTVSAVGSPNETLFGLGANFEEIDVHMSWQDPLGYVARHAESFERIWEGHHDGLRVVELDQVFATELLSRLGDPPRPSPPGIEPLPVAGSPAATLLDLARRSPAWAPFNLTTAALYPHQERVFMDALGRWPVRVLLADEVGLGKTLEAGIIVAYALRHLGLRRVTVLAPAGLLRQWQDEMQVHFDLDFWRYDSGSHAFLSSAGAVRTVPKGLGPIGAHAPDLVLISSQLARGNRQEGHVFEGQSALPDMLVVDEAHAARIRIDIDGVSRPTLMWRLLDDVGHRVPHLLLLSATPMQLHPAEYHSMLDLLGIPEWWAGSGRLDKVLALLASSMTVPSLQEVRDALSGISSTIKEMNPDLDHLGVSAAETETLGRLAETGEIGLGRVVEAQRHWTETYSLLVKTHPGHLLTIRNTRGALSDLGYSFPARRFEAPPLTIDPAVADFYSMVDVYLESAFGKLEAAAHPEKANALGFMKSTYRQRLASSLRAAEVSLGRRLANVESVLRGDEVEDASESEELGSEWEDDFDPPVARGADVSQMLEHACRTELSYLHDLVRQLEQLDVEDLGTDPKLDMLMTIVGRHLAAGDQLLVFSRYTDTVDACLELFLERHLRGGPPPHAKYTGGASWIDKGDGPLPVTKEEIRRSLDEGEITVVFCSDAASEGLNLQAARVIVNVDVPWNPARLEQRIGRIARLGQKASEVDVYNLWYPDSVEAKIYNRLLTRRDLYELAVGEFPEIVGSAIRNELAARYSTGPAAIGEDPIRVLQELRGDQQRLAIQRIWNFELSDRPESQRFREHLADLVSRTTDASNPPLFSVSPGDRNTLSLNHPALDMLARVSRQGTSTTRPLSVVLNGSTPIGFVLDDKTDFIVIPGEELPNLLGWLALGDELKVHESWTRVPRAALADLATAITTTSMWMPKPNELTCVYAGGADPDAIVDSRPDGGGVSVARLDEVMI